MLKWILLPSLCFLLLMGAAPKPKPKPTPRAVVSCIPTFTPGCVVTLSWTDNSTNEEGFRIHGKLNASAYTVSATVPANTTSWVHSNIVQAATENVHCYQVSAYNSAGESARTPELCYTVPAAPTIPIAPSNATLK